MCVCVRVCVCVVCLMPVVDCDMLWFKSDVYAYPLSIRCFRRHVVADQSNARACVLMFWCIFRRGPCMLGSFGGPTVAWSDTPVSTCRCFFSPASPPSQIRSWMGGTTFSPGTWKWTVTVAVAVTVIVIVAVTGRVIH